MNINLLLQTFFHANLHSSLNISDAKCREFRKRITEIKSSKTKQTYDGTYLQPEIRFLE